MATLPTYARILADGYSEQADYGVVRTEMDGGVAKQRPRRSLPIVTRNATVKVDSLANRLAFQDWMRTELNGGAGWFDLPTLDGAVRQARFVNGQMTWTTPGQVWLGQTQIETVG